MSMQIDCNLSKKKVISQRGQYRKGGVGRLCWDYRDNQVIFNIEEGMKKIIDIGCGEGITLEKLIKKFPDRDIKGIDCAKENVEICKGYGLPATQGTVYELNIKDDSVDCCIFTEVIEHLEYPQKALKEIHRILRKDGLLLLLFPNDFIFKIARLLTFKFKEAFYEPRHLRQWTPWTIRHLLNEVGFKIIKQKSIPFYFWMVSLHHLVLARKKQ